MDDTTRAITLVIQNEIRELNGRQLGDLIAWLALYAETINQGGRPTADPGLSVPGAGESRAAGKRRERS